MIEIDLPINCNSKLSNIPFEHTQSSHMRIFIAFASVWKSGFYFYEYFPWLRFGCNFYSINNSLMLFRYYIKRKTLFQTHWQIWIKTTFWGRPIYIKSLCQTYLSSNFTLNQIKQANTFGMRQSSKTVEKGWWQLLRKLVFIFLRSVWRVLPESNQSFELQALIKWRW